MCPQRGHNLVATHVLGDKHVTMLTVLRMSRDFMEYSTCLETFSSELFTRDCAMTLSLVWIRYGGGEVNG